MAYYLQMDGVDDYVMIPSLTYDEVILDFSADYTGLSFKKYIGGTFGYLQRTGSNTDAWSTDYSSVYKNGVSQTNSTSFVIVNERATFRLLTSGAKTGTNALFANNGAAGFMKGNFYSATFKSAGVTVAFYDFTLGNVLDQSGNGHDATNTGGTFVSDATGTAYTASLSDSISSSETFTKLLSRMVSDSVSATDSIGKSAAKVVSDSLTTSDAISKRLTVTVVDTIATSESSGKADSKALNDTVASSDSITSLSGKAINLSDSITITDAISKALTRHIADTITAGDTNSDRITRILLDTLTLSDAVTISKGKAILLSDSITISDSVSKAALLKKIEALTMTDTLIQTKALHVQLYDVIVTTDTLQTHLPNAPQIIGRIELKASRTLHVYLLASRQLRVELKGGLPVAEEHQNIDLFAGESKVVGFTATENSLPINLTGATIKWGMRRLNATVNDVNKDTVSGIAITDAANGKFDVTFLPIDTATLYGDFQHQAEIVDANANASIVAKGTVSISRNYFK